MVLDYINLTIGGDGVTDMTWIKGLGYLAGGLILAGVITWAILWVVPPSQKEDLFQSDLIRLNEEFRPDMQRVSELLEAGHKEEAEKLHTQISASRKSRYEELCKRHNHEVPPKRP